MKLMTMILVCAAALALLAAGCGSDDSDDSDADAPAPQAAGAEEPGAGAKAEPEPGSADEKIPPKLAANRAQANEILEQGSLESKLAELKGFPIVVNQWGSWCPPCREEFPFFGEAAEAHADEVAFLGIDMQDERGAAEEFLDEAPVPFPSIDDPNAEQITSLGGGVVSPTTVFIDEKGEIVNVFQGAYVDLAQLEADIEKFLLN